MYSVFIFWQKSCIDRKWNSSEMLFISWTKHRLKGHRILLLPFLGETTANIFNSTKYSAALPQLQDHEKEHKRRKKRKREMDEHSPIPSIQESTADVAISKEKDTELTQVVDSEIQNLYQVLPHTNEQNSGRERAPDFTNWWATTPQRVSHRLWAMLQLAVSRFHSQHESLGQELSHTPLFFFGLAI